MNRIAAPLLVFCLLGIAVSAPAARASEPVMCTMEAKLCPDGSYVSRTGPNCEFAPCPGEGGQTQPAPIPVPPPPDRIGEPGPGGVPGGTPGFAPGNPGPDNSGEE
jgi:hypothetical protein